MADAQPPEEINISVPQILGVSPDYIDSFNFRFGQDGGSFTANFINADGAIPNFISNSLVTLWGSLVGIIDYPSRAVGNIGDVIRVEGQICPPNMYNMNAQTYQSTAKFKVPNATNTDYLNIYNPGLDDDPTITFIDDMSFIKLIQRIASDNGIALNVMGGVIDYRIFTYSVAANASFFQVAQELSLAAGANAVVNGNIVQIVPWGITLGSNGVRSLDDLESDFMATQDRSEFTGVQIKSSTEITPYNSMYIGMPEKIGSLSFEAGPISVKDISLGSGVVQSNKQWTFPKELVTDDPTLAIAAVNKNAWLKMTVLQLADKEPAYRPPVNYMSSATGIKEAWDFDLLMKGRVSYGDFFKDPQITKTLPSDVVNSIKNNYTATENDWSILVRWARARAQVQAGDDIHPFIIVLPSEEAQDIQTKEIFNMPDTQELMLVPLNSAPTAQEQKLGTSFEFDVGQQYFTLPQALKGITPTCYGFWAETAADNVGFDPGFVFYVDSIFSAERRKRRKIDAPRLSLKIFPEERYYTEAFGTATFTKGKDYIDVENTNFDNEGTNENTLAKHLSKVFFDRAQAHAIMPGREGAFNVKKIGGTIKPIKAGYVVEDTAAINAFDPENQFLTNSYTIRQISPFKDDEGADVTTKARIQTHQAVAINYSGNFCFARGQTNDVVSQTVKVSATGSYSLHTDSGLVNENTETIKGSWSLYGIRRKTFQAIYFNPGNQAYIFYTGVSHEADSAAQAAIQARSARKNIKVVESPLVTDAIGDNSHVRQLGDRVMAYISMPYTRFTVTEISKSFSFPLVGSEYTVEGVTGTVVEVSGQLDKSGMNVTVTVGNFPVI